MSDRPKKSENLKDMIDNLGTEEVAALAAWMGVTTRIQQFIEQHFKVRLESPEQYRNFLYQALVEVSYSRVARQGGLFYYAKGEDAEAARSAGWTDVIDVYGYVYGRSPGSETELKVIYEKGQGLYGISERSKED